MEMKLSGKPLGSVSVNLFMFGKHTTELHHSSLCLMMYSDFEIFSFKLTGTYGQI